MFIQAHHECPCIFEFTDTSDEFSQAKISSISQADHWKMGARIHNSTPTMATFFVEYDKDYKHDGQPVKDAWVKIINKWETDDESPCGMLSEE